jgi:hypothetical protein
MINLGDRCLSCIIDHIHTYATFSSLPSEACESVLLLLKGQVPFTEELLLKFGECYLSCLDISKEDMLDYTQFMDLFSRTPSSSTISSLNVSYSEFDDDDILLLEHFPRLSSLNLSHCDNITGCNFSLLHSLTSLNLRGCTSLQGDAIKYGELTHRSHTSHTPLTHLSHTSHTPLTHLSHTSHTPLTHLSLTSL